MEAVSLNRSCFFFLFNLSHFLFLLSLSVSSCHNDLLLLLAVSIVCRRDAGREPATPSEAELVERGKPSAAAGPGEAQRGRKITPDAQGKGGKGM